MDEENRSWHTVGAADDGGAASSPLDRLRRNPAAAVTVAAVAAVAVALGGLWLAASASSPRVEFDALAEEASGPSADPGVLVVDVAGAVHSPGLYRLPAGARVGDAITAAGGFGPTVDVVAASQLLNLAAPLTDGQKIVVPARGASAPATATSAGSQLVDLNRASQSELEALPGVGPVTARKIISARTERPFASARELVDRKIVGQAVWEKIQDLVTAG